jgi:hypothetical protein
MLTRGKIMKRILLTSTALVAFAGAAAADVSFSGSAEFSYNDQDGGAFSDSVSITASGSQALNNGYTASASLTLEDADTVTGGDITIANDNSSLTYHISNDGAGAAHVGEAVGGSAGLAGIFSDDANESATVSGSATVAGATIGASLHAGNAYEIGVSTDLGGTSVAVGYAGGDFGAQLSGAASSVDYTLAFASNDTFGVAVSTTAGGADLSLSMAEGSVWEIGASMPLGAATVGLTLDNTQAWEVSLETALDAVSLGFTFDNLSAWTMSADYAAGDLTVGFDTDSASAWNIDLTYDLGNGLTAGAGTTSTSVNYAEVNYDLGGGAALSLEYGSGNVVDPEDPLALLSELGPDEDIAEGTTLSVSFSF